MRYAIFSDVHANLVAWEAVCQDMAQYGLDVLVCLGDSVGYGPRPVEVLESIRSLTPNILMGNHDAAAIRAMDWSVFNDKARYSAEWTAGVLTPEARDLIEKLPLKMEVDDLLFVHAEVCEPGRFEYVDRPEKALENFQAGDHRIIFMGHTHQPEVYEWSGEGGVVQHPEANRFLDPYRRYIVNVGSVGDPRNAEDFRARYVIYDSESGALEFRAVPFDIQAYREDFEKTTLGLEPYFLLAAEYAAGMADAQPYATPPARSLVVTTKTISGIPTASVIGRIQTTAPSVHPSLVGTTLASKPKSQRPAGLAVLGIFIVLVMIAGIAWYIIDPKFNQGGAEPLSPDASAVSAEPESNTVDPQKPAGEKMDIVFEDFESETYVDWKVEGTAFGSGPVVAAQMPIYQGVVGAHGKRLVNSHHTRGGEDDVQGDRHIGMMTSKSFQIERAYIHALIGGGSNKVLTSLELIVDGEVVARLAGDNNNKMSAKHIDVSRYMGKTARLRIVDRGTQAWGNIGVDHIVFSDQPERQ